MKSRFYPLIVLCGGCLLQGCASSKGPGPNWTVDDARAYFEELRSDFNSGKVRTLNKVMKLSAAEADKFWPIYREYERDLAPVSDRRLALLQAFVAHRNADTLTGEKYRELSTQWLQLAQDRLELWKKYHTQISESVSPLRAAQFLQVENQMALVVDVNIASEMPQLGTTRPAKK